VFAMISNQEFYSEIEYVAVLSKKKKIFRSRSFGLVGGDFQNINFLRIIDCYELVINCVDEGSRGTNECQVIKICRI